MKSNTAGKVINWILTIIIFAMAGFIVANVIISKINGKPVYLFNYMFLIVKTDSMTPELQVGDFIIAKYVPIETVHVGDNAIFLGSAASGIEGKPIVHKVIKTEWVNGVFTITTQGIKAGAVPDTPTTAVNFLGKQVLHLPFEDFKQVVFGLVVLLLLLLIFIISRFILKTIRENHAVRKAVEMGLEKARIENELRESMRIEREKQRRNNDGNSTDKTENK